jgi:hypothetical protein
MSLFNLMVLVCVLALATAAAAQQEPVAPYSTSASTSTSSDLLTRSDPAPKGAAPLIQAQSGKPVRAIREFPKVEIFCGYVYANLNLGPAAVQFSPKGQSYNGMQFDLKINAYKHVGLLMDLAGEFGRSTMNDPLGYEPKLTIINTQFLVGPEFATRRQKINVFAHTLVGLARTSLNEQKGYYVVPYEEYPNYVALLHHTSLALGVGGGVEKNWQDRVAVRVIEVDYVPARVNGNWQSTIRAATGVTMKF